MSKTTGLGKGLDNLIPDDLDVLAFSHNAREERVAFLPIDKIVPNEHQPRRSFDEGELANLAESVRAHGVLQPIIVTKVGDNHEIVAGERRWRAAQMAGLDSIPAIITTADELKRAEVALIENVQREDLKPLELAEALRRLHYDFAVEYDQIAQRIGKAPSTVVNIIRLTQLPEPAKEALQQGKISEGHARAILALRDDEAKQMELLEYVMRFDWSVRKAEAFVVAYKEGAKTTKQALNGTRITTPATQHLADRLKTQVNIHRMAKGGGRLMISYKNDADLQRIMDELKLEGDQKN